MAWTSEFRKKQIGKGTIDEHSRIYASDNRTGDGRQRKCGDELGERNEQYLDGDHRRLGHEFAGYLSELAGHGVTESRSDGAG
jgi:hypothetical protein